MCVSHKLASTFQRLFPQCLGTLLNHVVVDWYHSGIAVSRVSRHIKMLQPLCHGLHGCYWKSWCAEAWEREDLQRVCVCASGVRACLRACVRVCVCWAQCLCVCLSACLRICVSACLRVCTSGKRRRKVRDEGDDRQGGRRERRERERQRQKIARSKTEHIKWIAWTSWCTYYLRCGMNLLSISVVLSALVIWCPVSIGLGITLWQLIITDVRCHNFMCCFAILLTEAIRDCISNPSWCCYFYWISKCVWECESDCLILFRMLSSSWLFVQCRLSDVLHESLLCTSS